MKVKLPLLVFTNISLNQINKSNYYKFNAFQLFSNELKIYNIPLVGLYMEDKDVYKIILINSYLHFLVNSLERQIHLLL